MFTNRISFLPRAGRRIAKAIIYRAPTDVLTSTLASRRDLIRRLAGTSREAAPEYRLPSAVTDAYNALTARNLTDTEIYEDVEALVYYGDPRSDSHFRMWDPVFRASGIGYASILRDKRPWFNLLPQDNMFPVATLAQGESLIARMPRLKAIFYPANHGRNLQVVRNSQFTHVFLGHGDSAKASSANKVFRLYDEVWVAGEAHIKRFDSTPGDYSCIKFRKVGQPWLTDFFNKTRAGSRLQNVGYFPTWQGYYADSNYSSLEAFGWIVAALAKYQPEHFSNLITKIHPWSKPAQVERLHEVADGEPWIKQLEPTTSLQDALTQDLKLAICDNSSSIVEALYLGIPLLVYVAPDAQYSPDFADQHDYCYLFSTEADLDAILRQLLVENSDPLAPLRQQRFAEIIDIDAMENDGFGRELRRVTQASS